MRKKIKITFLLLILLNLISCSDSSIGRRDTVSRPGDATPTDGPEVGAIDLKTIDLAGTVWKQDCHLVLTQEMYAVQIRSFLKNSKIRIQTKWFSGPDCQFDDHVDHLQEFYSGKYKIIYREIEAETGIYPINITDIVDKLSQSRPDVFDVIKMKTSKMIQFGDTRDSEDFDGSTQEKRPYLLQENVFNIVEESLI